MSKFADMFGDIDINQAKELLGTAKGIFGKGKPNKEEAADAAAAAAAADAAEEAEKKKKEQTTTYVIIGVVALFMLRKFKMI